MVYRNNLFELPTIVIGGIATVELREAGIGRPLTGVSLTKPEAERATS